jgi:Uma2 family endonuclease
MGTPKEMLLELLQDPEGLDDELRRSLLEALLQHPPRPRRITYEEFLARVDEDTLAEWVDGEMITYTPASLKHQQTVMFLAQVMGGYVESHNLGRVVLAPFQMKLAHSGREPDLIFVATKHLARLRETYLDGPADLVVEILSSESRARDRGDKFYEYEEAGVVEYWLVDPEAEHAEFYALDERGRYRLVLPDPEGIYRSRVLQGFWLRLEWLWEPPPVLDVMRQLGLV